MARAIACAESSEFAYSSPKCTQKRNFADKNACHSSEFAYSLPKCTQKGNSGHARTVGRELSANYRESSFYEPSQFLTTDPVVQAPVSHGISSFPGAANPIYFEAQALSITTARRIA